MSYKIDLVPQDEVRVVDITFGPPGPISLVGSVGLNEDMTDLECKITFPELPPEVLVGFLVAIMDAIGSVNVNGQSVGEAWAEA